MVCIDDIDAIAADSAWEEALFDGFNRLREADKRFIITAIKPAQQSNIQLLDLKSRLHSGLSLQLQILTDEEKQQALMMAAKQRGFILSQAVVQYLLTHYGRSQAALFDMLSALDKASLEQQRKLTIPFVKQVLKGDE